MFPFATGLMAANSTPAAPTAHAYWRLYITASTGQENVSDLQFRATAGGADQVPVCTAFNMGAAGSVIGDVGTTGGAGWQAFDSDPTGTYWNNAIAVLPLAIGFQFPSAVNVEQISLTLAFVGITAFKVQYSDDGSTWVDRASFSGLSLTAGTAYTFDTSAAVLGVSAPSITSSTGFYGVGDTLTGVPGTYAVSSFGVTSAYRWLRGATVLATTLGYTVVSGDVGTALVFEQTVTNGIGPTVVTATTPTIVTPTFTNDTRVPAGDMNSGSDSRLTAGDMQSGTDLRLAPTRTA